MVLLAVVLLAACSTKSVAQSSPTDAGVEAPADPIALACVDAIEDVYRKRSALAPFDATRRGEIVRCAFEKAVSREELAAWLPGIGADVTATTGIRVYRIAYRTERIGGREGTSAAVVFVPTTMGTRHPVVVSAHGSVGLGDACAPSRAPVLTRAQEDHVVGLALAAQGIPTIDPDYAGYAFDPPHAWLSSEEEGHSVLDAARALRTMLPDAEPSVFLVGHSQGGHAVLSAQAMAKSYGAAGEVRGVVALAPVWWVAKIFAAMISDIAGFDTTKDAGALAYATMYFYGHGEAYDGAGGGLLPFQESKRDAVRALVSSSCMDALVARLSELGSKARDYFDPAFVDALGNCGALDTDCDSPTAMKWLPRFRADRPKVDATIPIAVFHGGKDTSVPPDRAACGIDRLSADLAGAPATLTLCGDAEATHDAIKRRNLKWITSFVQGAPQPCGDIKTISAAPLMCATPPTNAD